MQSNSIEGFETDNYAALARVFSDLELLTFLSDPAVSTDTIEANARKATDAVLSEKRAVKKSLTDNINSADANVVNTAYYVSRTQDLVTLADDVDTIASGQLNSSTTNKSLSLRQNEINEWANFSKLEILYFMQIIFISLSLIAILSYLLSITYISSSLFWTLVSVIFIIDLLIIVLKSRFTMMNRDGRYWHKMRFANEPHKTPSSS